MSDPDGISQQLEIRDLGDKGCEIIVTVVNESEEPLTLRGGVVEVERDGRSLGLHRLSFDGPGSGLLLGQFEIAHGRFHLAAVRGVHDLHCRVMLDCRHGEEVATKRISRRIRTDSIRRG